LEEDFVAVSLFVQMDLPEWLELKTFDPKGSKLRLFLGFRVVDV
jgi:hypothetical protein